jgi:GNAT superfamily N-acetyltransferase
MHVATWQAAYRGIVPDPILDAMDPAARAARYTFDRRGAADPATWIAVDGDRVVGMVSISQSRDEDLPGLGEIQALYVAPERWRSGAGTRLMTRAEALLLEAGFRDALLWVFRDNARGRAFYEAAGWQADGLSKTVEIGGRELVEVRYRRSLTGRLPDSRA